MTTNFNEQYRIFAKTCEEATKLYNDNIIFSVLQYDELFKNKDNLSPIISEISRFYDVNWNGNADYIHIPSQQQVMDNYMKYPILISYHFNRYGHFELLGVTTIKHYHNGKENINPYYPIENANFFELTGIIVSKNSPIKGIGKRLYGVVTEAAREYNKIFPNVELIFVGDCRNDKTFKAAAYGSIYTRQNYGSQTYAIICGYYNVRNLDGQLVEAPTMVVKYILDPDTYFYNQLVRFDYEMNNEQFNSLLSIVENRLMPFGTEDTITTVDIDAGIVEYTPISNQIINIENIRIRPNGTELGNDRIPNIYGSPQKTITRKLSV